MPRACAQLSRRGVRQRNGLVFGDRGPFGGGAVAAAVRGEPYPNPLTDAALVDSVAARVDVAGTVVVRDLEAVERAWDRPAAGFHIGGVDAGDLHPYPDLTRCGHRPGNVLDPEHLPGRSEPVVQRGPHDVRPGRPVGGVRIGLMSLGWRRVL